MNGGNLKLGLFVCFSILLFLISILILGVFDGFKEKAYLSTVMTESVQGLSVGSAVKYLGVPIGSVSSIAIDPDGKLIRVEMAIELNHFRTKGFHETMSESDFYVYIDRDLAAGLRCQMELDGIGGSRYIELDFHDKRTPLSMVEQQQLAELPKGRFIPCVPSVMSDIRGSLVSILDKLNSVDYHGISTRVCATLDAADEFLGNPKLKKMVDNLTDTTASIQVIAESLKVRFSPQELGKLMQALENTLRQIDDLALFAREEVKKADIPGVARETKAGIQSVTETVRVVNNSLAQVQESIAVLTELLHALDENPAMLIRGKK